LIGHQQVTKARPPAYYATISAINDDSSAARTTTKTYAGNSGIRTSVVLDPCFNGGNLLNPLHVSTMKDKMDYCACLSMRRNMRISLYMQKHT
jgi:hypothetical protein